MPSLMKLLLYRNRIPEERAKICSDVLIESDLRGIDSHGLGRLKPIYCDRMDQGILQPNPPIDIVKESDTTALVDGNLGLGLYIGPYCMNLAIEKAKKHGVGFVVARRSTHYGIAGYYGKLFVSLLTFCTKSVLAHHSRATATMATEAGCIGWTGTNARFCPRITPQHKEKVSDRKGNETHGVVGFAPQ